MDLSTASGAHCGDALVLTVPMRFCPLRRRFDLMQSSMDPRPTQRKISHTALKMSTAEAGARCSFAVGFSIMFIPPTKIKMRPALGSLVERPLSRPDIGARRARGRSSFGNTPRQLGSTACIDPAEHNTQGNGKDESDRCGMDQVFESAASTATTLINMSAVTLTIGDVIAASVSLGRGGDWSKS